MGSTIVSNKKTPNNFGALPPKYSRLKNSEIVILPVPFDKTSSWIKGAAKGPAAIINASRNMELYDIETDTEVYTRGIHTAKESVASSSKAMVSKVYKTAEKYIRAHKFVVVLGGEHTVSLGSIQAHADHYNEMSILHLDAHSDMRDSYEGNRYSHACVMARVKEQIKNIVSVGIRSMDSSEIRSINRKNIFYASKLRSSKDWIKRVTKKLSSRVYVTIDLDVFDPSIMPSTGTPEPGGLGWYEVIDLLEHVSEKKQVVGFDVVELCPSRGVVAPDFLAAKLVYKLLSFKFA